MRILFSARPAYGHVYPMMPLALTAREAGHHVEFATAGQFLPKLQSLGFTTHPVGLTIEEARDELVGSAPGDGMPKGDDGRPDLDTGGRLFIDVLARHTAADLMPIIGDIAPDVVVYENGEFGAAVVAAAAGVPAICHSISPRLPDEVIRLLAGTRLDELWAYYGKSPAPIDVFTGDVYLDIFPAMMQQPSILADPARMRLRPIPWSEPSAPTPPWVGGQSNPLVYLTLGTVVATDDVLLPVIEGLAGMDVDVLVALGSAAGNELGPLPGNVHLEPFVHQVAVLRHADLVVHHGGSGTVLGALALNKPQVILPKGADQFFNADVMAAAGLARVLEPRNVTADAVATLAKAALDERDRPLVQAVHDEIVAMPDPSVVVERLVERYG